MSDQPAHVLVVVPDVEALQQLTGSLAFLSSKKYRVHVGVQCDPPGAPSLAPYDGLYAGLSVGVLPAIRFDRWRALATIVRPALDRLRITKPATGWRAEMRRRLGGLERALPTPPATRAAIDAQRPDILVVTGLRGADAPHVDYVRAARALGIPSIYVMLGWDEARHVSLAECPDCVAVWNIPQRREAVEAGVPLRRTCVIGAHLATDLLDERAVPSRKDYCLALGIDSARRLVVLALPRWNADELITWTREWNSARLSHGPATRESHVIVISSTSRDAEILRGLALPGVVRVIPADGHPYVAAQAVHAALAHADAVVTLHSGLALEAFARTRPVLAFVRDPNGELARLCRCVRQDGTWPLVAASIEEQAAQLAALLEGRLDSGNLAAARTFVRIHGNEIEPAFLLAARVIREVVPRSPVNEEPAAPRAAAWLAGMARALVAKPGDVAPAIDGRIRVLMTFESPAALDRWSALMDAIVARGHRVRAVMMPGPDDPAAVQAPQVLPASGISVDSTSIRLRLSPIARMVAALRIAFALLDSSPAPEMVRWRRRLEAVELPGWTSGLHVLARRPALLNAACRLLAAIDRHLPASRGAARLVRGVQPGAVIAPPSLEPATAVGAWAAQTDVLRAARARGLPVAAGVAGSASSIDDALAAGALRPQGVNRVMADALAEELEQWIATPKTDGGAGAAGLVIAIGAAGALAAVVGVAAVASASSTAARAASRMLMRIRGGLARATRPRSS